MSSGEAMRRIVIEIVLILLVALFLSLTYNAVSPSGLRILPKKKETSAQLSVRTERSNLAIVTEEALAKVFFCHPELVSGSHNTLNSLDAEINSA
jgi:uncharacterized protein (DUF58 family)